MLFQATKIPPDAPTEGRNSKESKSTGQICLMKSGSKLSFLVSYKQVISLLLSTTFVPTGVPFSVRVQPSDIPVYYFPSSIVCHKKQRKKQVKQLVGVQSYQGNTTTPRKKITKVTERHDNSQFSAESTQVQV